MVMFDLEDLEGARASGGVGREAIELGGVRVRRTSAVDT
jgi:hypothetical protein